MKRRKLWLPVIGLIMLMLFLDSCSRKAKVVGVRVTDDGEPLQKADVELWLAATESGEFE